MDFRREIEKSLADLRLRPIRESEILDELTQHAEARYDELLAAGLNESEAAGNALADVCERLADHLKPIERRARDTAVEGDNRRRNLVADLWLDLRYAARTMRKNPVFAMVVVITIAIGIGANALIFTLVDRILLNSLPYTDSDRLVRLIQAYPEIGLDTWGLSQANFARYRDGNHTFENVAAYSNAGAILTGSDKPEFLQCARVTADFFKVFAVNPVLGRTFVKGEDTAGKNNVAVLSHGLWQSRFGGDPQIIGRWIVIADVPTQVIGVMPSTFRYPTAAELWLPVPLDPQAMHPFLMSAVARLKPGVTLEVAATDTTAVLWQAATDTPEIISRKSPPPAGAGLKTIVTPLKQVIVGNIEKPLLILQIAVALVLLIVCANVANLLLSRAARRTHEVSLRLALGAARGRIIRQLLTESLLLAGTGSAIGLMIAWWALRIVIRTFGQGIPRIQEAGISSNVLLATLVMTVLTGLTFGLAPALRAYALGLKGGLSEGQRSVSGPAKRGLNSALVVMQLALSLLLLIGAALMVKSFQRLTAVKPGFETENVLTMIVPVSANKGEQAQSILFYKKLLEEVRALPGVRSAAVSSNIPFSGRRETDGHIVEGHEPSGDEAPQAEMKVVSPGYFRAMGMTLVQGRDFNDADINDSPLVAVVDQTIAHQYFPNGDVIGRRIRTGDPEWYTIIGVVPGVKEQSLSEETYPHIYFNYQQLRFAYGPGRDQRRMYLVVNTDNPAGITNSVRERIRTLNPDAPVYSVQTMDQVINKRLESQRLINLLLTAFSGIALLLAAVGTYGVMSVFVSSRSAEFAIRGALGASPRILLTSVLRQGLWLALIGCGIGLAGAWALTRAISSQLFSVSATDLFVFTLTPAALISVALLASYSPARRAAKTDPAVVLRS